MIDLTAAGLNETESKTYKTLITKKEWRPSELALIVGESRTNMYKILDGLVAADLAYKYDKNKKIHYRASNPSKLIELARRQREKQQLAEKNLEIGVQELLSTFIKSSEQPGIQFYLGKEEIEKVYQDQVDVGLPIYFMLSHKAIDFYGYEQMHKLRMLAVNAKIPRYALTPDNIKATKSYAETDKLFYLTRTWLNKEDYTAPFEWGVYGNKVYFVTFGEDALGMIIDSPAMAQGLMQVYKLIEHGQRNKKDYTNLPRLASKYAKTG